MNGSGLSPISSGLSASLHLLVAALSAVVLLNATSDDVSRAAVIGGMVIFVATYGAGMWPAWAIPEPGGRGWWWVAVLSLEWLVLLCFRVEATYLVFPLFVLYMRLLGGVRGTIVVALSTVVAVVAFGLHRGGRPAGATASGFRRPPYSHSRGYDAGLRSCEPRSDDGRLRVERVHGPYRRYCDRSGHHDRVDRRLDVALLRDHFSLLLVTYVAIVAVFALLYVRLGNR